MKNVITGTSSGIGRATAELLEKSGVEVFRLDRSVVDLSRADSEQQIAKALEPLTEIDWLIHVAGFVDPSESFENLSTLEQTLRVNLLSSIYLTKAVLPKLKSGGGIIFVSSAAGISGNGNYPLYASSKGAVNTFAQSLAFNFKFEHAADNKKSIVVAQGRTNTAMRERVAGDASKYQSPDVVAQVMANIILGKSPYKNGDIVVVKDSKDSLHSKLTV